MIKNNPYSLSYFVGEAISAGAKVLGAGLGAIGTAINSKKYDAINQSIAQRKQDLQSMYQQQLSTPYTSTAEGANAVRIMQRAGDKAARQANDNAIRTGVSPEAQAAAAASIQEATATQAANLAAQGTARQDALRQQAISQTTALDNQVTNNKLDKIRASNAAWGALVG